MSKDSLIVRSTLLVLLIVGLIGNGVELLLLGHDESLIQLLPIILIAIGVTVIVWHMLAKNSWSLRVLRATMTAFIASGLLGIALHYRGNVEFQREMDPTIGGLSLFTKAMQAKAPPALAPAAMTWFGLLGLVGTYSAKNRSEKYETQ
jgi:hypothetical protein